MKTRTISILLFAILLVSQLRAQYCSPSVVADGVYFTAVYFNYPGLTAGVSDGSSYNSISHGYTNKSNISSGKISSGGKVSIPFNLLNPTDSALSINVRVFADWDGDNDFNGQGETVFDFNYVINPHTSFGSSAWWTNASTISSLVHFRFAVRQGGQKASPCGGYSGEIEDYTLASSEVVLSEGDHIK